VIEVDAERFEGLVADALDLVPEALAALMDNVVVIVEDDAPEGDLLGLYEGVPLPEREAYGGLELPDRITIYRRPICAIAADETEVVEEVAVTVVHEIAHHFGIDDDRLHELGWD
jgi:predicted Zn-dependent protease with MMP-like domain